MALATAAGICAALLTAVVVVAALSTPDPTGYVQPGVTRDPRLGDVGDILFRNSLVLTLHAMACIAGFIAGSSLPLEAERYRGWWRWVHDKAGPLAIGFVALATAFSLLTQAYILGGGAKTLSVQYGMPTWRFVVGLLPHAVPELIALFLPLAAWTSASRRGAWSELMAATFVTVALAVPVVVALASSTS